MSTQDIHEQFANSDILVLKNEENVYSIQVPCSSQMKKMSELDIQEELANSGILELTNKENVCSGYSGGAYQLEKKNLRIFWSSQMRQEMAPSLLLSQRM
jgi:hypothetical protein